MNESDNYKFKVPQLYNTADYGSYFHGSSKYSLDEVLAADEALITASSIYVLPVSKIDDHVIAAGQAGRFTVALRKAYLETARAEFYRPTDI